MHVRIDETATLAAGAGCPAAAGASAIVQRRAQLSRAPEPKPPPWYEQLSFNAFVETGYLYHVFHQRGRADVAEDGDLARWHLGPAGAWWLRDRFQGKVPVRPGCEVLSAHPDGGRLALRVREQGKGESELRADHVVAGTGFEVDLDRLPFLAPDLRSRIDRIVRGPRLDRHFQSSVGGSTSSA